MASERAPGATAHFGLRTVVLLVALALVSRAALVAALPLAPLATLATTAPDDARYYARLAQHLAATGEYAENHLRAYRPPGYPAALAATARLGLDSRGIQLLQNIGYLACLVVLARWAADRGGRTAGVVTVLLGLLTFNWLVLPQELLSETLFLGLLVFAVALGPAGEDTPSLPRILLMGLVFGGAALVREVALPLGVLACVLLAVRAIPKKGWVGAGLLLVVGGVGLASAILPWTWRNFRVLGALVPITTNGPINLYMGNNPSATGEYHWALPDSAQAVWNRPDQGRSNELYAMRSAKVAALAYIRAHPGTTLALMPRKLWALWGPPLELRGGLTVSGLARLAVAGLWLLTLAAGCAGLWWGRRDTLGQFLILTVLFACAVHVLTYGSPRYRSAYEFLLLLPAGLVLSKVVGRLRRGELCW